ncbi:MAG: LuxR C-terminal-related transcriptional regulator [Sulfurifustis sp.]
MDISGELFRKVVTAAYDLHRHRDAATYAAWLLRVLTQTIDCDSALLITVDLERQDFDAIARPTDTLERIDRRNVWRWHAAEHPFVARCTASRSIRAFRLGDLAPRAQFEQTELYRTFYRPRGIEHQLLMLVATPSARWRAVALSRRDRDFSDEECAALEALWPHIMLAQRNLGRRRRVADVSDIESPVAETAGVIVITSAAKVTVCSEQARLWITEYFDAVFIARAISLPETVERWVKQRIENEGAGRRLRPERRDPLVITRGDRCLVLDLIVDHGKNLHLLALEEVVLNAPAAALETLNLTAREAEVLAWVAQGKTNREVGIILGASARTVQKHLEHIFQKIGVESRTAAVLRAWQAARYHGLAPAAAIRPNSPR